MKENCLTWFGLKDRTRNEGLSELLRKIESQSLRDLKRG